MNMKPASKLTVVLTSALTCSLLGLAPAVAATVNVSELVTGVAEPLPAHPGNRVDCTSLCRYAAASGVGMSDSYTTAPGPYQLGAWPVLFSSGKKGFIGLEESLPTPAPPTGQVAEVLSSGRLQRAAVDFDSGRVRDGVRRLSVQTWKTGSGAATASFAVRITTAADGPRRTYLEFTVPTLIRSELLAWNLTSPSGNENTYSYPRRLQTRSAVDVYVDGLPVWTAQRNQLEPQRYGALFWWPLDLDWGHALPTASQPLNPAAATLFLGTLPGKTTLTVVVVMRTDVRVEAPTCRSQTEFGVTTQRCNVRYEGLSLPATAAASQFQLATPEIAVYTR